jgi:hypothetical protein
MPCIRCAGLRVPEMLADGGMRVMALRCVRCGDVVDQVISRNRHLRQPPKPGRARTPVYGTDRYPQPRRAAGLVPEPLSDPCWFLLRRASTPA